MIIRDIIFLIGGIVGIVLLYVLTLYMGRQIIWDWAEENSFELLESHYAWFGFHPFILRSTKAQMIFRIKVRVISTGQTKVGWARCGNWFFGVIGSNAIKVIWDEPSIITKLKNKPKQKNDGIVL